MAGEVFYGELAILGLNGTLTESETRRKSKICLFKRPEANGVRPGPMNKVPKARNSVAVTNRNTPAISFTLSRNVTVVVEYVPDPKVDMFQIGRSTDDHIDFVVSEPKPPVSPNDQHININDNKQQSKDNPKDSSRTNYESAVSRFACRIHIDRDPPYTARLYAAGFDASNNIFLGERAIKWKRDNSMDGLTTNGVMMLRIPPTNVIENTNQDCHLDTRSQWREVSVCGSVYEMRSNRCIPTNLVNEDNILTDMTIIDLCGVTLLWRSRSGLKYTACPEDLMKMINGLNQAHIQCPVLYRTLKLPLLPQSTHFSTHSDIVNSGNNNEILNNDNVSSLNSESDQISPDQMPYVYVSCGHVHGWHNWRAAGDVNSRRTCPLCLQASLFIPLRMGIESAFYVDRNLATHCFNPCGHIASENTVRYWCSLQLLNRHNFELHARCPFCLTTIRPKPIKLLFQSDLSEEEFLELLKEQLYVRTLNMEKYETLSRCKNENKSKIDSLSSSSPQSYLVSENHRDTTTNNNSSHSPPTSSSHNHHRHEDRLYSSSCSSPSSSDEIVSIPSLSHNISSTSYQLNDIYSPNGIRQSMLLESSTSFN
ncbi:E3 ubiquitin-protein ligase [Schistosoma japonicum]|nr:E3 ubiquitin-protein ligase [Schistosoma japonicum]KAH8867253.1 E3 ubiquitin-protein ligase [Schistosoma japonicum]